MKDKYANQTIIKSTNTKKHISLVSRIVLMSLAGLVISSCASLQGQKMSPEQVKSDLAAFSQKGNLDGIKSYFDQNASLFPDGVGQGGGSRSEPCLYIGNRERCFTFEDFKKEINRQNEVFVRLKSECGSQDVGLNRLRCLTSPQSPCSGRHKNLCTINETKETNVPFGLFELQNPDSLDNGILLATDENIKWYWTVLKGNLEKANEQRKIEIAQYKDQSQKNEAKNKEVEENWIKYCKTSGAKAVFKALIQPINKFDDKGIFSYVSVGFQHCIGNNFNDRFKFLNYCPGNTRRTCGIIYGLPKGVQPMQTLDMYIRFVKKVKGSDESGLKEEDLAGLEVLSDDTIKKFGLE